MHVLLPPSPSLMPPTNMRLMEVIARLNGGTGTPNSWRSTDTPDDQSLSPTSCAGDSADGDLNYTIGVTEGTPYLCHFCEKAFPRLSYLKRHEQSNMGTSLLQQLLIAPGPSTSSGGPQASTSTLKSKPVHSEHMPFKCDYCQRLFKHKRSRDRHVKLHTGDRKYRCTQCEAAFSRSDHLKIHLKTHDNAKPYQCAVCNRGYNTAAALTSHMQNHKKDNNGSQSPLQQQFRCLQCAAVFTSSKELQIHVSTHESDISSSEKRIPCSFCTEKFHSTENLRQHVEQRHVLETQGKCPECKETFVSLEALLQHKKTHQETKMDESKSSARFSCGFCTKNEFLTMDSLQQHMTECHVPINHNAESFTSRTSSSSPHSNSRVTPDTSQSHRISPSGLPYSCEYCTMKFNSVNGLQRHTLATHSFSDVVDGNQENILCTLCNKVFQNAAQLTDHVKSMHDREICASKDFSDKKLISRNKISSPRHFLMPDAPLFNGAPHFPNTFAGAFICSHCNAGLPDFESFRTHLKSHLDSTVKKFTCFECDGQFPTEDLLDHHVANHFLSTATEYGCQSCLKMFVKPDHLQKHLMDIHAHQLYQCALCKDIFESKVNIQVHFAVKHSNECHMFKCTSCNAVFRSNGEFDMHVKVAHLSKLQPFRCYICDMSFPTEVQMQIHFQGHKKPFSCIFCREEFHVEFLLDRHIQEKHADQNSPVSNNDSCSVQNLSIKSRAKSDNEECFSSNQKKQLRCDICDAFFASESSLNLHRRQVHNIRISGSHKPGQTILSLFCAYCNEPCKSRTDLENHMKTHTPTNTSKHKCNICDEICPSAGTLAEHKLSHCKIVTDSTCVMCHTALKLEEHFHVHLHQHNPQGLPAPCVICRQTLMSEIEVQVHAKFHLKNAEPLYSCCVCGCQSSLQHLIITGTQENHTYMCKECFHAKGDDLRCSECNVKFENSLELEKHRPTHNRKTYQCIKCQMSFESEAEIQAHVTTHVLQEGTNHACHRCPKIFDSPAKLQCHLIEHTFEGHSSYSCYMCSSVFASPHLIQQHMLEHGLDTRPYDCSFCHQKFFFRAELDNHSFIHRDLPKELPNFPCMDCDKTFTSLTNLQNHSKLHDQKMNNSSLKCSLCPEMFDNSIDMQQHHFRSHADSELHEGKKSFPCSECDQVFPCMSNLQGHLRIHTQGTKYTCTECNKEFALSRNLTIHMRSHSGVKPYECPICKKRFARKENRKAHIKSHSGQKPFMCPHCGKTFSRKCHVKEHMRIHITSTTHPCEMCTETFPSTAQLKCHLVDVHQKNFDFSCSVCNELFESSESLDQHLLKEHDVRTSGYNSSPTDDLSESSLGQSSSSVDLKDSESSECSSIAEESDTRDSPISATEDCGESRQTPEVAA